VSALRHLPHGSEFRFLDRLTALVEGKSGSAQYIVRGDEAFLRGHFPEAPMMPGVLLIEAAAQLAGVVAQSDPAIEPLRDLRLTALRSVKILGTARPGEAIDIEATVMGRLGNLIQAQAIARVGDQQILEAQITLSGA